MANHADLIVIGAGAGGHACTFRAADLDRKVVMVDPRNTLGGVCLNESCISSKALLHAAQVIREAHENSDWGIAFAEPKINLDTVRARKGKMRRHVDIWPDWSCKTPQGSDDLWYGQIHRRQNTGHQWHHMNL